MLKEMQNPIRVVGLFALFCAAGCTGGKDYVEVPVYQVSGALSVDGKPAHGAYLLFHPVGDVGLKKGNKPFARVDEFGRFDVSTYETADGAPAGAYKVTVVWPENPDARGPSPDRLQGRYATPEKTTLQVSIDENTKLFHPWDLK